MKYKNILKNLKSDYLVHLEHKKLIINKSLKEIKQKFYYEQIMVDSGDYKRDYRVFAENKPSLKSNSTKMKIHLPKILLPGVKVTLQSQMEKNSPEKYDKKEYSSDNFSNIYRYRNLKRNTSLVNQNNNIFFYSYKNTHDHNSNNESKDPPSQIFLTQNDEPLNLILPCQKHMSRSIQVKLSK